jgi:hypothetical protein
MNISPGDTIQYDYAGDKFTAIVESIMYTGQLVARINPPRDSGHPRLIPVSSCRLMIKMRGN